MMTAADTADRTRPFVAALVESAKRATGSQMAAYDHVARNVGVSRSWVRKLLGRQQLTIEHHEFWNVASAYRSLCERLEAEAELNRRKLTALRGEADEALESSLGFMGDAQGPATRPE